MSSTYSTNLGIELIGTGDQAGSWGNTTNSNLGTLIEQAISGYVTQAITDGADTVITIPNGASGVARNMYIEMTGALTAARNLIVPANKKLYFIYNNTTGGYAVTVKVSGQTGVSVANGSKVILVSNGTDIVSATSSTGVITFNSATISTSVSNQPIYITATGTSPVVINSTTTSGSPIYAGMEVIGTYASGKVYASLFKTEAVAGSGYYRTPITVWNNDTTGDNAFIAFATESTYQYRASITYNRASGVVAYNTSSDYRLKDIYGPITDSGEKIDAIKVYRGKMHGATLERPMTLAHELQDPIPYAVTGTKDAVDPQGNPIYQQVDYSTIVPLLIVEIQSLRARVAALEAK